MRVVMGGSYKLVWVYVMKEIKPYPIGHMPLQQLTKHKVPHKKHVFNLLVF